MINAIDSVNFNSQKAIKKPIKSANTAMVHTTNSVGLTSSQANSLKAQTMFNFTGNAELSDFEQSLIKKEEIRIPNLFELKDNISISRRQMPEGLKHLNQAGINFEKTSVKDKDIYTITNDMGDTIFVGKVDKSMKKRPEVIYKQGKFMPEITIKDESLGDKRIKMFAGSRVEGKGFEFVMPGAFQPSPVATKQNVSFTGKLVISTLNKEPRTVAAVNSYLNSELNQEAIPGDYIDTISEYDPTIIIPAGGFGERFKNITREAENKPSAKLPTDDRYRIIGTTLNLAASAGVIGSNGVSSVEYLSQMHEIDKNDSTYYVDKYKTDGGAIAEAFTRDIIRNDHDAIILNADIFTNADITRAYHALKTLPYAAVVIPYYPVNGVRAKSFGLMGVETDKNGNLEVKHFIEKPKYTSNAPLPSQFVNSGEYDKAVAEFDEVQTAAVPDVEDTFIANPGMYFISKEAAKVLVAESILDPDSTGLGKDIMPKIVQMANDGKLIDKHGNQLKVYTVPLEAKGGKPATWDDIGTAEAYLRLIKDVAYETELHGTSSDSKYYGVPHFVLEDFKKNSDLVTGIVFDSPKSRKALDAFKEKYEVSYAMGNIFVTGN